MSNRKRFDPAFAVKGTKPVEVHIPHQYRQATPEAPEPAIDPLPSLEGVHYPAHWNRGNLLDLKKYTNGSAMALLLGENYDPTTDNAVHFDSLHAAQQFVSAWYSRETQQRG